MTLLPGESKVCYPLSMDNDPISKVLDRARAWPLNAQQELVEIAREIEAEVESGAYHASLVELRGIDRGLRDAEQGRFATEEQIEAIFAKHRV